VRNVLSNWGAFVLSAVVNFVLSPYVVHSLGNTGYGIWVLIGSLVGYLGLLDLGVRGAVMRFIANLHAASDHQEAGHMASAGLFLFSISGLAAVAISIGLALGAGRFFTIPPEMVMTARIVLVIGGVNIAVALVSGVFGGIITAMQRFDLNSGIEVTVEIIRASGVFLVLHAGHGLVALALVQLTASLLRGGAAFWISRRVYPALRLTARGWSRPHVRQLMGFSVYATLLSVSSMIILELDSVVIGAFLPVGMIAFFGIAVNLTNNARSLVSGISQTIAPRVSALEGKGDPRDAHRVPVIAGRLASLVILPVVVTFLLRGTTFIRLWMGADYAALSGKVLWILSIALMVAAGRQVIASTMLGLNRHRALVPLYLAEAAVNLGLSVLLVQRYGLIGVAWGTTIPNLITSLIGVPWIFHRVVGVPMLELWRDIWIRPLVAILPFGVATYAVDMMWGAQSLYAFFFQILLVLPLAALGAWLVALNAGERDALAARLPRALRPAIG
jgi:O-antigen/teichoic acid export membrane protein